MPGRRKLCFWRGWWELALDILLSDILRSHEYIEFFLVLMIHSVTDGHSQKRPKHYFSASTSRNLPSHIPPHHIHGCILAPYNTLYFPRWLSARTSAVSVTSTILLISASCLALRSMQSRSGQESPRPLVGRRSVVSTRFQP